ncbi:cytochrome p450 oxidoreductase [Pandoraea morbifera]|uniref:Cytochrome p450 oxidoreductase n=1 Tax=Pandoraea morbifera TaxID=2508300 RepID=A0A5E4W3S9_9BURK|nr:cytochrome P450 [Pandoraea morbifera]VVE18254.1 cytochrome p450 oxidoreductase [Pandoraea morbifera]
MLAVHTESSARQSPANPLAAVSHPDPYPYYAALAARQPFDFDASLGLWVAAGSHAVAAVLRHPACGVRPLEARVPAALNDGAAGDWFRELVRMNDGAAHASLKPWLSTRLATLRPDAGAISRLREASQAACADAYLSCGDSPTTRLDDFVFRQPIYALAAWLGVAPAQWADVHDDVQRLVAAMAEAASPSPRKEVLARGHRAAATLRNRVDDWLDNGAAPGTWLHETSRRAARDESPDDNALAANIAGLFTQTHDACAGLVANSLRRIARRATALAQPDALRTAAAVVGEVLRLDPPVQNTRRFLHAPAVIGERTLAPGDAILVVLAAAPATDATHAHDSLAPTFGQGQHTCPGHAPAVTLAAVGVQAILASHIDLKSLAGGTACHPLANIRIARFDSDPPTR